MAVLGSALVNAAVLDGCPWLAAEDFYEPVHGRIFAEMLRERAEGRQPHPATIGHLFETVPALAQLDGGDYLRRMAMAAETIGAGREHAMWVRRLARKRRLGALARRLVAMADDRESTAEPAELLAAVRGEMDDLCQGDEPGLGRDVQQVVDEIVREIDTPSPMRSTGIRRLDESLGGGLPDGYVVGLKARPKQFKTGVCHTLAVAMARQAVPTLYLACEMGSARLVKRMLGHVGGFNSGMFRHLDPQLERTVLGAREALPGSLRVLDCPGLTFDRLRSVASEAVMRLGTKLFVLDYWQLVKPSGEERNRAEFLDRVAQWIADFAHEHRTTWIVASQENREGHTRGSDGLLMACDWIAALRKHDEQFFLPDLGRVETLWMDVEYSRDGPGDSIGGPDKPLLFIHPHGPHLAELP